MTPPTYLVEIHRENKHWSGTKAKHPYWWQVSFHCPKCSKDHYHGFEMDIEPGKPYHRVAHCPPGYHEGGYYIVLSQHDIDKWKASKK